MLEKIQQAILAAFEKIGAIKIKGMPKGVVYVYSFVLLLCIGLFIWAWVDGWNTTGRADLPIMNQFLFTITGSGFVAAVLFIVKGNIDEDGDGVPEKLMEEKRR